MKILSSLKRKCSLSLKMIRSFSLKNMSQISFFPSKMSPKALKLIEMFTGGTAVVASGALRGCGGGTLRRRPLWLSTLLSTSPWSARTKLGVATAVLVLSVESLIWEGIHWTFGGSNPHEREQNLTLCFIFHRGFLLWANSWPQNDGFYITILFFLVLGQISSV